MMPLHRAVLVVAGLLVGLLVLAPAGLLGTLLPGLGFSAASGNLWRASLTDPVVAGVALGDGRLALAPLGLLAGRAQIAVDTPAASGTIWRDLSGGLGARDLVVRLPAADLATLVPLSGQLRLKINTLALAGDGTCRAADGTIDADVLADAGRWLGRPGPSLAGRLACVSEGLVVTLAGGDPGLAVSIEASLPPFGGAGRVRVSITTADTALVQRLAAMGFQPTPDGAILNQSVTLPRLL